jgi:tetratricopeptide (TPR) repeat protein
MAYNKSKHVEAAQKLLNQGKVAQAIAEYQHILKNEPKDQVTLMTIGELYIRQGETFQAMDYFERLAQLFVNDGFLTKAIAVYKRIAKLAPEEVRPLERLAELYVQQGVLSEARPIYLQLAEIQLKKNKPAEAVSLLKKLLVAEPDNLRIQIRLADLYQAMNQTRDAVETYVAAAERVLARGDQAECERLADKALKLDPNSMAALTVKARCAIATGKTADASVLLAQLPGLEKGGEQADLLLDLYLRDGKWDKATDLGLRVFENDPKNFGLAQKVCETLLEQGQTNEAMDLLDRLRVPMIDAGEHDAVLHLLTALIAKVKDRLEPYEWLVDACGRMSDSFRMPDALAQLGDAALALGEFKRAKEVYEQLCERNPENEAARRKLNEVLRNLGHAVTEPEPEPAPSPERIDLTAELPEAPAPKLPSAMPEPVKEVAAVSKPGEPALDEETQRFINQSLTDVDLFASYGLTQKAISLLEAILRRAPQHTVTLEKLLDFHLGAGDERRTAELAAQLEQIHSERGDTRNAERFAELRRRFQRAAGLSDEQIEAAKAPVTAAAPPTPPAEAAPPPVVEAQPVASAAPPAQPEVHEVDLSEEWASLLTAGKPAEGPPPAPPGEPEAPVAAQPAAKAPAPVKPPVPEPEVAEPSGVAEFAIPVEPAPAKPAERPPIEPARKAVEERAPAAPIPTPHVEEEEPAAVLDADAEYELVLEPTEPTAAGAPPEQPAALSADQFLAELASEMEQLGIGSLEQSSASAEPATAPAVAPSAPAQAEQGPLKEVFEEFRAELGEMGAEDEDLETHYNLGIAFREMGLLEEAISEFQKVAKANDRGRAFRYALQCCTLLGLAFMEKGQPGIAAMWYERALHTPGIDPETALALRYDLGVAQEAAGNSEAALKSFTHVYAMNIDYRDVADRIATLEKAVR